MSCTYEVLLITHLKPILASPYNHVDQLDERSCRKLALLHARPCIVECLVYLLELVKELRRDFYWKSSYLRSNISMLITFYIVEMQNSNY